MVHGNSYVIVYLWIYSVKWQFFYTIIITCYAKGFVLWNLLSLNHNVVRVQRIQRSPRHSDIRNTNSTIRKLLQGLVVTAFPSIGDTREADHFSCQIVDQYLVLT